MTTIIMFRGMTSNVLSPKITVVLILIFHGSFNNWQRRSVPGEYLEVQNCHKENGDNEM